MSLPSLLAVHAHPDDESIFSGGVLAQHAAAGARTAVVTATWVGGSHRAAELARALEILGAGAPRLLGYADARVPESAPGRPRFLDAPLDEAVGAVVGHIRAVRPRVVIAPDPYGGMTGHPDHVHTHRVTSLAVRAAGLARLFPEAGAPWQPSALYLATHPRSAVEEVGRRLGRPGTPTDAFYVSDDAWITATVDVAPGSRRSWRRSSPTAARWNGEPPPAGSPLCHRTFGTRYWAPSGTSARTSSPGARQTPH